MGIVETLRSLPRRIRDSVQQEGLWRFGLRIVLSPMYRAGALGTLPLDLHFGDSADSSLSMRVADEDDIEALVALGPEYYHEKLRARLGDRQQCLLAFLGETIVAVRWAGTGEAHLGDLALALPLREEEMYAYDAFVHPRYRGNGYAKAIRRALDEQWWQKGFRTHISFATLGRKPFGRYHPYNVATIRVLRLGPFRKLSVKTYGPKADYWRERLKELRWA